METTKEKLGLWRIAELCNVRLTKIKSSSLEKDHKFPTYRIYVNGSMREAETDMVLFATMCREEDMIVDVMGPREATVDQAPTFVGEDCEPFGASF
jgi:hypothetical protein